MDSLHAVDNSFLNQPEHADNKFVKSPSSVGLIALGVIFLIGGAVASGMLYSHLGYVSLSCLSSIPVSIALIVVGVRCGKTDTPSSTKRSGHSERVSDATSPSTTNTQDSRIASSTTNNTGSRKNNGNIVSIGSHDALLDEKGIREELKKTRGRKDIEVLIIYGKNNVKLNTDPGFVELNPKKVILVGAKIVHEPSSETRLDEKLRMKKEWLSSPVREFGGKQTEQYDPNTFVKQLIVNSIYEALAHEPPSRGWFKEKYHLVYQVSRE